MHPADRHPHVANLDPRSVFAAALHLYRLEPARVAGTALLLLGPAVVIGVGSGRLLDALRDGLLDDRLLFALAVAMAAGLLGTLGTIVYAGVLDELVGSVIRDDRRRSVTEAIRALPIGRLIGADIVVATIVGVVSAVAVVPGLLLLAMLGIVGPVVNIEGASAFDAARMSLRLTARHLGLTVVVIGVPLALEVAAHHWLLHVRHEADVLAEILLAVPLILTVGAFVGLCEVELAYALLARDDGTTTAAVVATTAPADVAAPIE